MVKAAAMLKRPAMNQNIAGTEKHNMKKPRSKAELKESFADWLQHDEDDDKIMKKPAAAGKHAAAGSATSSKQPEHDADKERNLARRKDYFFKKHQDELPANLKTMLNQHGSHKKGKLVQELVTFDAETQEFGFEPDNPVILDIRINTVCCQCITLNLCIFLHFRAIWMARRWKEH